MNDDFEEKWQSLLGRAKAAKAVYDAAVLNDVGSKKAAAEMYAANRAVREFCLAEQRIKKLGASALPPQQRDTTKPNGDRASE
jgi:hypothetical protein